MTKFLNDVKKQPTELNKSLNLALTRDLNNFNEASNLIKNSKQVIITGIGASWHAGIAIQSMFLQNNIFTTLVDSSEMMNYTTLPKDAVVILLSRSGKSVEVLKTIEKCKTFGIRTISICNDSESLLAKSSDVFLPLNVSFDNAISVVTYTSIILVGGILALLSNNKTKNAVEFSNLENSLNQTMGQISFWEEYIKNTIDFKQADSSYFLARSGGLASAYESALLWAEGAKSLSIAIPTGTFRHGLQEVLNNNIDFYIWIDKFNSLQNDTFLVNDLIKLNKNVTIIGDEDSLKGINSNNKLILNDFSHYWKPIFDIIPMQLLADKFAAWKNNNCDEFLYCNYIVQSEGGLL